MVVTIVNPLYYLPFLVSATASMIMLQTTGPESTSIKVLILTTVLGFMTTLLQAIIAANRAKRERAWNLENHQNALREMHEEDKLVRQRETDILREQAELLTSRLTNVDALRKIDSHGLTALNKNLVELQQKLLVIGKEVLALRQIAAGGEVPDDLVVGLPEQEPKD